jgi:hypothetical protein
MLVPVDRGAPHEWGTKAFWQAWVRRSISITPYHEAPVRVLVGGVDEVNAEVCPVCHYSSMSHIRAYTKRPVSCGAHGIRVGYFL